MGDLVMPAGLQCWDANGALRLDLTDSLTRVLGSFTTPAFLTSPNPSQVSGSVTNSLLSQGRPWCMIRRGPLFGNYGELNPHYSFSGTTLSWWFPANEIQAWYYFNGYGYQPFNVQSIITYGTY